MKNDKLVPPIKEKYQKSMIRKRDLLARLELAKKGINPIDLLKEVFDMAMTNVKTGRGYSDSFDAGSQYLAVAFQAAKQLSEFYAPKMGQIKPEEVINYSDEQHASEVGGLDAKKIRQIILNDPCAERQTINIGETETPLLEAGVVKVSDD